MSRVETREYDRRNSIVFRRTAEKYGGLSNMAPGFPLEVNGIRIRTSEALYQACRFPHLPDVQRLIINEGSPMAAKMRSKPFRDQTRSDWDSVRVKVMRWCLRVKLAQNWESFGRLLRATGDQPIVEESTKDEFWGAHPLEDGGLVGANVLGRLLMELREEFVAPHPATLRCIEPLPIPQFLLYSEPIGLLAAEARQAATHKHGVQLPLASPVASDVEQSASGTAVHEGAVSITHDAPERLEATITRHPRRLIEVDLPIKRISAHARREKSIRHGHISTLHIWWARRPLAACRAVICAALWPDPDDPLCPVAFREKARNEMLVWTSHERQKLLGEESRGRFEAARQNPALFDQSERLRIALLDFIADFSNWDSSTVPEYLHTSRALTQAAHQVLHGAAPGTRPFVVDPFAGGGSIPLEALRIGADVFASDLNPVPVLLNKVVLDYIPRYGQRLADEVRKWGEWIRSEAEKELADFYPQDSDGATPIAYLWARTIRCEGPECGAEVPLIKSLWLGKKPHNSWSLRLVPNQAKRQVDIEVVRGAKPNGVGPGTVRRGSATCLCCGYTTPPVSVRKQLQARHGGAADARLLCVATVRPAEQGRFYRIPTLRDIESNDKARLKLDAIKRSHKNGNVIPTEPTPVGGGKGAGRAFSLRSYGMDAFEDLFTPRQLLTLITLAEKVNAVRCGIEKHESPAFAEAIQGALALNVDKMADYGSSLASWSSPASQETVRGTFSRQALSIVWDFAEAYPFASSSGGWTHNLNFLTSPLEAEARTGLFAGHVERGSATSQMMPDDSVDAFVTDPPYYDAIPYADLSDFFIVWLKRSLQGSDLASAFSTLSPKDEECVVDEIKGHDAAFFERTMGKALAEGRRVTRTTGIGVVVFAHKSTAGWEAQLQAMINAGWVVTGSWPIDTERQGRVRANDSAALASSVHLICRPRENLAISTRTDHVGDWRDVLQELPVRIHEWMPRLAEEGVVGADAIFACLGPALEVFSRYSRVEKASGEAVTLKEYLEHVWAAVAREALSTVLHDSDSGSLEPDARLSVIWLWTLGGGDSANPDDTDTESDEAEEDDPLGKAPTGYVLEFDTARKIAQGLGANLETLEHVVAIKGDKARLVAVADRAQYLFGKTESLPTAKRASKKKQIALFAEMEEVAADQGWGDVGAPKAGTTTLDRVHQAMLLFASGRGEALKRFLVEEGVGQQAPFWKLSQALAALYPSGSNERRWVEGVLARKKGLGFG